jgi:zinc protease
MSRNRFAVLIAAGLIFSVPVSFAQATKVPAASSQTTKAAPQTSKGIPASWKQVPIPKLPAFKPQEPIRVQLSNGMVIFLTENHELPLIDATARIRGGSSSEPAAKAGMLDMYGDVWRTGGTEQRTGDAMDDFLEARAAKLETGAGSDSTYVSLSCLKGDFDDVFAMFVDLLQHPAFREDKLALAKNQMNTGIARRNDDTDSIAEREGTKLAYGANNPYARVPEYFTVAAVTREDLFAWHKQHVYPNDMIFGITGDFDAKQMEAKLRAAFENWQKGPLTEAPHVEFTPAKPGIYFVNKTDVNQSEIRMVGLGIVRKNPDYFSVAVMNEVFGGGFSSRLFSNLRTKLGLAYSVGGGVGSSWDHVGITSFDMGTKSSTTVDGIQGLRNQMDDLKKDPPTDAEMQRAKDNILNSFIFRFDTPEKVLRERMAYEYYGYPADWLQQYRSGIEKTTLADVRRVIDKYIHKDQLAVLVVGNGEEMTKPLSSLGPVKNVDITIPTSPNQASGGAAESAAPKVSNVEGKALIAKTIKFLGGEKLASIKSLRFQATSMRSMPQGEISIDTDTTIQYPDRLASSLNAMGTQIKLVITPNVAFQAAQGQVRDLPPSMRDDAQQTVKRDIYNIAQNVDNPSYAFVVNGTEKVGDTTAAILDISGGGTETRWLIDPASGQLLRTVNNSVGQSGPTVRTLDLSTWKMVDGINFYTQRIVSENGKVVAKDTVKEWTVNPQVDPKIFEKPTQ